MLSLGWEVSSLMLCDVSANVTKDRTKKCNE